VAIAPYPQYRQEVTDHEAEREIDVLQEIVTMARTLRTESKLDPKQQLEGAIYSRNSALQVAQRHDAAIQKLANVKLEFKAEAAPKASAMRSTAQFDLVLHVPQAQEEAQRKRQEKDKERLVLAIASLRKQLADEAFLAKAPTKIIDSMRQKLADYEAQLGKIEGQ
jgi:valyl-tRNA synthetase